MRHQQRTLMPIAKIAIPDDYRYTLWFSEWWDGYPLKVSKQLAQRVFAKHIRTEADYRTLSANMPLWAKVYLARSADKRPYPATFLNSGAWREPPPEDLLRASMGIDELLERGEDPTAHGWRKRRVSGGWEWER